MNDTIISYAEHKMHHLKMFTDMTLHRKFDARSAVIIVMIKSYKVKVTVKAIS